MQTEPTFPVNLTVSEMEQTLYTNEMCIATLMQSMIDNPMRPQDESESHTMVYTKLMDTTTKLRAALSNLGVQLEAPMYQILMQSDDTGQVALVG